MSGSLRDMNNIYSQSSLPLGGQNNLKQRQEWHIFHLEESGAQPALVQCNTTHSSTLHIQFEMYIF